jgi:hypothetical protein
MYVHRKIRALWRNHCCREKAVSIMYSGHVCRLSYPACNAHAPYYIVIRGLSASTRFFHISLSTVHFSEKVVGNVCFDFSRQILSETFLILRRIKREIIINYTGLHVKYALFLSHFNEIWIFWTYFPKNTQMSNFVKSLCSGRRIIPCGGTDRRTGGRTDRRADGQREKRRTDRQTGMKRLIVAFQNLAKAPKTLGRR